MLCALLNPDNTSPQLAQSIDTVLASASLYHPVIREADRTDPCPLDSIATEIRAPLSEDAAAAAITRIEGTQELSADDILEVADKISSAAFAAQTQAPVNAAAVAAAPAVQIPAEPATLETLPPAADKSQEIECVEDANVDVAPHAAPQAAQAPQFPPPARVPQIAPQTRATHAPLRPDDTWQALGRALGSTQPSVMVDDPNATTRSSPRESESIYPVEVPVNAPPAPQLTGTFETWASRSSAYLSEASASLRLPTQRPRFAQAKWIVGGVSGVSALVCLIAIVVSTASTKDSSPPPAPAMQSLPQATQPMTDSAAATATNGANAAPASNGSRQSVREDHSFSAGVDPGTSGNGWAKSVMASAPAATDAPGVSIDSLPKASPKKKTWHQR